MTTIHTMLAIAASQNWVLHQMDVKNTFLHMDLKEDVYMHPPAGLLPTPTFIVCKLRRSLNGLKQAPCASLFLRKTKIGIVILLVYVNDIIITGTDLVLISQLK
jgi:hypothetical protein